jgi:rare lipoprotein A
MHRTLLVLILLATFSAPPIYSEPDPSLQGISSRTGLASWYWEFSPGINKTTANMEIFDSSKLTCAAWDFPFNTILKVTNLDNEKSILVRVNDRGPAKRLVREGRIIDLSKGAFERIADPGDGLIRVRVEIVQPPGAGGEWGAALQANSSASAGNPGLGLANIL